MARQNRINLTAGRIRDFSCPPDKTQAFLWDEDTPGFAVRATPPGKRNTEGTKAFIFQAFLKVTGTSLRIVIGDTKTWGIDDARKKARSLQRLIDQDIDPREQRRAQEVAQTAAKAASEAAKREKENRQRYTLRALCEAYGDLLEARGKVQSARQTRSIFKCHVFEAQPGLATLPARDVTAQQIATIIRSVAEQGKDRTAGILRSYLSAAFNAARKAPFDAKLPSSLIAFEVESNPVEPVSTIAVKRGERSLNADEMKRYMEFIGDSLADIALKLALFSGGQRMAQLLRVKVSDYDEHTQTLRLWDSKGKRTAPREHLLPLAPKAAALVEGLIARAGKLNTPLLFSSFGSTQLAETTPGKRVAEIAKVMNGEPFDLRDIRRTCETMLAGIGISRDTRAQLLSHGLSGVQAAHYDRHDYANEKRAALIAWEQRLDDISKGVTAAKVVAMSRKRKAAA